jgi:NitT/TauT family transport system ATP-binding protein
LATSVGPLGTNDNADEIALSMRDVAFSYPDGTLAVENVSFSVRRGTKIGIVGPSGCGKSTLLALIGRFFEPSAGEITVTQADAKRHPVAMVFQKDTLLPWLTVNDNIRRFYKWNPGRLDKAEVSNLVAELVELAGLGGFEKAYPYQLSGGMRRRVAFLTVVAARPETLLLDEPFSALDEPTRVAIHQDAYSIIQDFRMTTILVTHDLAEAISLCDEILILTARPGTVHERYAIPFGAERDMMELRQTPAFLEMYGSLWHELSTQIARSKPEEARSK